MRSARNMLRAAAVGNSGGGDGGGLTATFTGADSPSAVPNADTGQVWHTDSGTWGIIGNQLYCSANTGDNHGWYDPGVIGTITATLAVKNPGGPTTALCFRYQDELNHWLVNIGTGNVWTLYERNAGSYTKFTTSTPAAASGDVVQVVPSGTNIFTVKINGSAIFGPASAASLASATKVGFRAIGLGDRWDDLSVVP